MISINDPVSWWLFICNSDQMEHIAVIQLFAIRVLTILHIPMQAKVGPMLAPWILLSGYKSTMSGLHEDGMMTFGSTCDHYYHSKVEAKCLPFCRQPFKCIFLNENVWIFIKISLEFVPCTEGPIDDIPALFKIMAWWWSGDKPLSEPMIVRLLMHICLTGPQWVIQHNIHSVVASIFIDSLW